MNSSNNIKLLDIVNLAANLQQLANDASDSSNNDVIKTLQKQVKEILRSLQEQNLKYLEDIQTRLERIENAIIDTNRKEIT